MKILKLHNQNVTTKTVNTEVKICWPIMKTNWHIELPALFTCRLFNVLTCAATVCDRVGNSLVMHAVLKPSLANPNAALNPAPPAPTTTASNV